MQRATVIRKAALLEATDRCGLQQQVQTELEKADNAAPDTDLDKDKKHVADIVLTPADILTFNKSIRQVIHSHFNETVPDKTQTIDPWDYELLHQLAKGVSGIIRFPLRRSKQNPCEIRTGV